MRTQKTVKSAKQTRKATPATAKPEQGGAGRGTVKTVMTRKPQTVRLTDSLGLVRQYMLWAGVRHMPVLDEDDRVAGMLSDRDLLGAAALEGAEKARGMNAQEIMRKPVAIVAPDERIEDASARMAALKVGCLPVVERGKLVGIVTTTDLLAHRSMGSFERDDPGAKAPTITARRLMTPDPEVTTEESSLFDAAAKMAENNIRHLPVVDADGVLVGMISDRDVRAALGDPMEALRDVRDDDSLTVGNVMAPDPLQVGLDTPITEVAGMIANEKLGAIPVVDEGDRPVGIISYVDLLAHLAKQRT